GNCNGRCRRRNPRRQTGGPSARNPCRRSLQATRACRAGTVPVHLGIGKIAPARSYAKGTGYWILLNIVLKITCMKRSKSKSKLGYSHVWQRYLSSKILLVHSH